MVGKGLRGEWRLRIRGIEEGCNLNVVVKKKEANALFWQQLMMKESLLKQKSRLHWIKEGDSNTKFFHSCLQDRRRKNQILSLQVEGRCVDQVGEVKMEVRRFFEEGFKEASFSRPVLGGDRVLDFGVGRKFFLSGTIFRGGDKGCSVEL